jgi:ParB/RepB/Spo0J family partition protein
MTHQFHTIEISKINAASFQPTERASEANIKSLRQSIENGIGLIYPVVVTPRGSASEFDLVDGHRRLAACKSLGWSHIPAISIKADQAIAFAQINHTARPMRGFDTQEIYLRNPEALSSAQRKRQATAEATLGEALYREVVEKKLCTATILCAESLRARNILALNPQGPQLSMETIARACLFVGTGRFANIIRSRELNDLGKAKAIHAAIKEFLSL